MSPLNNAYTFPISEIAYLPQIPARINGPEVPLFNHWNSVFLIENHNCSTQCLKQMYTQPGLKELGKI